jgi:hypothetical protein
MWSLTVVNMILKDQRRAGIYRLDTVLGLYMEIGDAVASLSQSTLVYDQPFRRPNFCCHFSVA